MKDYPTDEELELFIEQMEQRELYAPKRLREQILSQAFPKQTVEALPKSGGGGRPVQSIAYRLKIIAGMVAALIMLAIVPALNQNDGYWAGLEAEITQVTEAEGTEEKNEVDVNYILNEGIRKVDRRINSLFNRTNRLQSGNSFKMDNGGD